MQTSVLIPSYGRDTKLRACLNGLAAQTVAPDEVIVGLDGGSEDAARSLGSDYQARVPGLKVIAYDKLGLMPLRNRMLRAAAGTIFISLNDDVLPDPVLVESHRRVHGAHPDNPCVVTGPAPWVLPQQPTVFDELVARSDLIFFHPSPDPEGRVGYRDCFGLNFSAPVSVALELGGFHELVDVYGYDDTEMAHRMITRAGSRMLYARDAVVRHDHRYSPMDVIEREYRLGRAAWAYRQAAPEFTTDLFGRDIADPGQLADAEAYVRVTQRDARRIAETFCELGRLPSNQIEITPLVARMLTQHWILLKRRLWNQGLIHAANNRPYAFGEIERELCG